MTRTLELRTLDDQPLYDVKVDEYHDGYRTFAIVRVTQANKLERVRTVWEDLDGDIDSAIHKILEALP